jgi:formylglycine-generating enzyme required for sulfatase activity
MSGKVCTIYTAATLALLALVACASTGDAVRGAGSALRDCRYCPELVVVAAGSVVAGGNAAEQQREYVNTELAARELPAHTVTISRPLAVGRYEVTRGEFASFVVAIKRVIPPGCQVLNIRTNSWGSDAARTWGDPGFAQTDSHPVVCVSLDDANAYLEWLSSTTGHRYRLPSEGEWEYFARAGTTTTRFWGDGRSDACANANVADFTLADQLGITAPDAEVYFLCRDGYAQTAPVGSFKPNAAGLYDINGNVWEWTADCHNESYAGAATDGSARSDGDCSGHMDRGGSWVNSPKYLRTASRHKDVTGVRNTVLGFRVVRELE